MKGYECLVVHKSGSVVNYVFEAEDDFEALKRATLDFQDCYEKDSVEKATTVEKVKTQIELENESDGDLLCYVLDTESVNWVYKSPLFKIRNV